MKTETEAPAGGQAVVRAISLLKAFSPDVPEMRLSELSRRVGLTKTTTHRLMATLASEGLVERSRASGRYRLGPGIFALAARMPHSASLISSVHPLLEGLALETGETATLEILGSRGMMVVDGVTGGPNGSMVEFIGTQWPLHATSTGKILIAFSSDGTALLQPPLAGFTNQTITDVSVFRSIADRVKLDGFAISFNELEDDFAAVAAPVLSAAGSLVGALCVGGPAGRLDRGRLESIGERLKQVAAVLQQRPAVSFI